MATKTKTKFNRDSMWAAVLKLYPKAKRADDVTDEQLADSLRKKFVKVKDDDLADCTDCGESSPATDEYEACPFCGTDGVVDPEEADRQTHTAEQAAKSDEEGGEEAPAEEEEAEGEEEETDEEKPKRKAKAKKGKALAKPKGPPTVKDEAKLAKMKGALDDTIKEIRTLQKDMLGNGYELGRKLIKVFEGELWKARGKFRSFKEWCHAEAGFTPQMARNYMAASKEYERDDYLKLGVSKLAIIARLPPANRAPVIKAALEGADLKTIQKKVTDKRKLLLGDKASPGRPAKDPTLTAVVKVTNNETLHPFFAKDPGKDGKPVQLESYAPGAWAYHDLGNGVMLHVSFAADKKTGAPTQVRLQFSRRAAATAETNAA